LFHDGFRINRRARQSKETSRAKDAKAAK
jgi:hypothetical protein